MPVITAVAHAAPVNDVNDAVDALKTAAADHKQRVGAARVQIREGVRAQNPGQVKTGLGAIRTSKQQLRAEVQGILRGTLGGGTPE